MDITEQTTGRGAPAQGIKEKMREITGDGFNLQKEKRKYRRPAPQSIKLTAKEAEELMRHDSYRRVKGVMRQVGHGT